jgi:hypothetical protein
MTQVEVALLSAEVAILLGISTQVITIVGWWFNHRKAERLAARVRQTEYLRAQTNDLYGPLVFLVELTDVLWERNQKIMKAYDEYFSTRTGERFSQEMTEVIGKTNLYGQRIVETNREIVSLLRIHWGLIDADDVEMAKQLVSDTFIQDLESVREGPPLPTEFYIPQFGLSNCLGPKWITRPGVSDSLRRKFTNKQNELLNLTGATNASSAQRSSMSS